LLPDLKHSRCRGGRNNDEQQPPWLQSAASPGFAGIFGIPIIFYSPSVNAVGTAVNSTIYVNPIENYVTGGGSFPG
jgi:hypothetical protein